MTTTSKNEAPSDERCAEIEALHIAQRLATMAVARFREHGADDPRGAAIWDASCWITETRIPELRNMP